MMSKGLSVLAFVIAAVGLAVLAFRHHLFARDPLLIAVQVAAVVLMIWARRTFGLRSFHASANPSEGGLVTRGPYRYWRHPIYASILYFVWAGQVQAPTVFSLVVAVVISLALCTRMLLEERFLRATYPEYREYCGRAKRFLPFVA